MLPFLRELALALTGDPQEVDDLVQTTCERALVQSDQWMPGSSLQGWLRGLMQAARHRELQDQHMRTQCGQLQTLTPTIVHDGEVITEAQAALREVGSKLRKMPTDQRDLLLLVGVRGVSYKQAANIAHSHVGTIASRLTRTRLRLMEEVYGA